MITQFKNIFAVMALALVFTSCSNDDNETVSGEGSLKIEFDNVYGDADFIANTAYTNSNGEILKVNKVKYIVSNIVLTKKDGTIYTVPKTNSYFIVDELTPGTTLVEIKNIPAGNYTKISYGVGVDKDQFDLGATGQGNFLAIAQNAGMMWSWSAGYKFLAFEGTFTSSTVTTDTAFKVHTGQTGTDYNYTTINLDLPEEALVRTNITPQVHVMADLKNIVDGTNKLSLTEQATVMGGTKLALVTTNLNAMFEAHHVHND